MPRGRRKKTERVRVLRVTLKIPRSYERARITTTTTILSDGRRFGCIEKELGGGEKKEKCVDDDDGHKLRRAETEKDTRT